MADGFIEASSSSCFLFHLKNYSYWEGSYLIIYLGITLEKELLAPRGPRYEVLN
jgi:hypothetical protein